MKFTKTITSRILAYIEKKAYLKEAIAEALRTTGRKLAYQVMDMDPPDSTIEPTQVAAGSSSNSSQSSQADGASKGGGLFSLLKTDSAPVASDSSDRRGDDTTTQSFASAAPRLATLDVGSNVKGNKVYVDGEYVGATRLAVELPLGLYVVRVEKKGYSTFEQQVNLQGALTLQANLKKIVKEKPVIKAVPGAYTLTLSGFDKKSAIGLKKFLKNLDEVSKIKTLSVTSSQRIYAVFTDVDLDFIEEFLFEGLMEVSVDVDSARIELSENEILVDLAGGATVVTGAASVSNSTGLKSVPASSTQSKALTKHDEGAEGWKWCALPGADPFILTAGNTVDTCRASGGSLFRDKASAVAAIKTAGSVKLTIKSNRPWSDSLWVDGIKYGSTPKVLHVQKGWHLVKVGENGYTTYEKKILVEKEMVLKPKLSMDPNSRETNQ